MLTFNPRSDARLAFLSLTGRPPRPRLRAGSGLLRLAGGPGIWRRAAPGAAGSAGSGPAAGARPAPTGIGGGSGWVLGEIWQLRPQAQVLYLEVSAAMLARTEARLRRWPPPPAQP
ncbi:class I SAM-dependent methyltransferase [Hymenobacter sp. BRD67]|uniref:class I SAM-dependent methyltransferase n=1 Tax=Hymenobacter sp. BRD67 TaxID=2675877 RepID=UPI0015662752|nr:class I SAM-dependent methyltransferase [Hymenobacter sp. BRD67]QKG52867.1 hypothetical protein GKZ67_09945 [Hymenobacter sp. BRD67]